MTGGAVLPQPANASRASQTEAKKRMMAEADGCSTPNAKA
jgi:hypothetical protein